ncbi:MAG: hypothetical protein K9K81_12070 [Desulfobacteraceae bacterium]|nr:hypothetical protein [Desulfobacteraceae bacterium]
MQPDRLATIRPFEICSIRPPTENNSLTFRLTRNCYWNKCAFCPIYKTGAKFKKRSVEEVKEDVTNARILDDLLAENGLTGSMEPRQRIEYSLRSRLSAFSGQYGGLSEEVLRAIAPILRDGSLDPGQTTDEELKQMTAFVKSRLMP